MRCIQIDLAQSFEEVLASVLSLPAGSTSVGGCRLENDVELKRAIRGLHEAANGREVETKSSRVAIAPPIAAFLKGKPFHVATQVDFLIAAATQIICGSRCLDVAGRTAKSANENPMLQRRRVSAPPRQTAGPRARRASSSVQPTAMFAAIG